MRAQWRKPLSRTPAADDRQRPCSRRRSSPSLGGRLLASPSAERTASRGGLARLLSATTAPPATAPAKSSTRCCMRIALPSSCRCSSAMASRRRRTSRRCRPMRSRSSSATTRSCAPGWQCCAWLWATARTPTLRRTSSEGNTSCSFRTSRWKRAQRPRWFEPKSRTSSRSSPALPPSSSTRRSFWIPKTWTTSRSSSTGWRTATTSSSS
mmetsp:Transcript_107302/g.308722  ORF Transcript_107302/g.308722 Transcript_107302/m.308722 type:complete len:210 (+) Transcript_107302:2830-3459(+)